MEKDYGKLLFKRQTISLPIRVLIILLGLFCLLLIVGVPTIMGKMIIGVFALYLMYYYVSKRKESVSIYEEAIQVTGNTNMIIRRPDVHNLNFQTLEVTAAAGQLKLTRHHYPVLTLLKDEKNKVIVLPLPLNKRFEKKAKKALEEFLNVELILN